MDDAPTIKRPAACELLRIRPEVLAMLVASNALPVDAVGPDGTPRWKRSTLLACAARYPRLLPLP